MRRIVVTPPHALADTLGTTYLDRQSVAVRTAEDGAELLRVVKAWKPDLVIVSSALSDQPLLDVCKLLRLMEPSPRILVLLEVVEHVEERLTQYCDVRLVAPVTSRQMLATVAELLSLRLRRSPRIPLEVLVTLDGFGIAATPSCREVANSIDVSAHGMCVEAPCELQAGDCGILHFVLPGGPRLQLRGMVRLVVDEVLLHYALEFEDVSEAHQRAICNHIEGAVRGQEVMEE